MAELARIPKGVPKHAGGAPSLLTQDRQEKIADYLSKGVPAKVAAKASGITEQTYHRWKRLGREQIEAGEEGEYRNFVEAIDQAEAEAEARMVEMVTAAAPDDWRAAMTYLERRRPEDWGKKERIEHSGSEEPIKIKLTWGD